MFGAGCVAAARKGAFVILPHTEVEDWRNGLLRVLAAWSVTALWSEKRQKLQKARGQVLLLWESKAVTLVWKGLFCFLSPPWAIWLAVWPKPLPHVPLLGNVPVSVTCDLCPLFLDPSLLSEPHRTEIGGLWQASGFLTVFQSSGHRSPSKIFPSWSPEKLSSEASSAPLQTPPLNHLSSLEFALFRIHLLHDASFLIPPDYWFLFGYHLSYWDSGSRGWEGEVASVTRSSVVELGQGGRWALGCSRPTSDFFADLIKGFCMSRRLTAFPARAGDLLEEVPFLCKLHLALLAPSRLQQHNCKCSALSSLSFEVS